MSFSLSALNPISSYLSIVKDESKQVAMMVKSDSAIQRTEADFNADTVNITSATDILNGKDLPALQVVLGAYNMSGKSTQTGLLRQLLTQDPSASSSLAARLANTDTLQFARAMSNRTTVSLAFGAGGVQGFTSGGDAASTVSFRNIGWGTANASLTSALPARSWTYVLNNGSAAQSVAAALTTALQSAGSSSAPITGSYSVNANGDIVGSPGAPALTPSKDAAGNTTYSITLASNSKNAPIRIASVVSVNTAQAGVSTQHSTISAADATALLATALQTTGFTVATDGTALSITNPASNTPFSLASNSYSNFAAVTGQPLYAGGTTLPLGGAGKALQAGQTLLSGGQVIGTIQSVNGAGTVTLSAASKISLAAGARVDVAIGAGIGNIGIQFTAPAAGGTNTNILAVGRAATIIQAGQTITDGSNVVGIVKSVSASGIITFTGNLSAAVTAGDTLGVLPQVTTASTPALSSPGVAQSILSQYETNTYETKEGKQVPGLNTALYFSRVMPTITSINLLMSDPTLLKVVTTNLGIAGTFNNLDFDQQVSLLTSKIKFPEAATSAKVQNAAEQYLILTNEQALETSANNAIADMFGDNPNDNGNGPDLLSTIYPSDSTVDSGNVLSLFTNTDDSTNTSTTPGL